MEVGDKWAMSLGPTQMGMAHWGGGMVLIQMAMQEMLPPLSKYADGPAGRANGADARVRTQDDATTDAVEDGSLCDEKHGHIPGNAPITE